MKRLIAFIIAISLFSGFARMYALTPITVTVPPWGDKVKLQPLKTGCYEIGYVLSDDSQITAPGTLYVINEEGSSLQIGLSVVLLPSKQRVNATSMSTGQQWIVAGNTYITYNIDNPEKATAGYCTIWGYSKKFQALKISTSKKNAIVIYNPKSYKKMDKVKILEKIFEIGDQPGAFYLNPDE